MMTRNNEKGKEIEKIDEMPSGFRFEPTDRQIISDYLLPMVRNQSLPCEDVIIRKNLYGINQENISVIFEKCSSTNKYYDEDEDVLYFYTPLIKVSDKAKNICRVAGPGTWTGQDAGKEILDKQKKVIGIKKTFNFTSNQHEASSSTAPAAKKRKNSSSSSSSSGISWIMHEFSLPPSASASPPSSSKGQAIEHVICKIRRKQAGQSSSKRYAVQEPGPVPLVAAHAMMLNDAPPVPSSSTVPAHTINPLPTVKSIIVPASALVNSSPIRSVNVQPVNVRAPTFSNSSPVHQSVMAPVVGQQNCINNYYNQIPAMALDAAHMIPTSSAISGSNLPSMEASTSTSNCPLNLAASTSMPTNNQAPVLDEDLQQICSHMLAACFYEDTDFQPVPLLTRKMKGTTI